MSSILSLLKDAYTFVQNRVGRVSLNLFKFYGPINHAGAFLRRAESAAFPLYLTIT